MVMVTIKPVRVTIIIWNHPKRFILIKVVSITCCFVAVFHAARDSDGHHYGGHEHSDQIHIDRGDLRDSVSQSMVSSYQVLLLIETSSSPIGFLYNENYPSALIFPTSV